jgi:oligopeptidase B
MIAVIGACRQKLGIPASKTAIYGRSAGGFLVGSTLARIPEGRLFGAVFSEVPYVDILRTASNPKLPLTIGEYDEFGNPSERLKDFAEMLKISPINSLPNQGAARNVLVITRTGLQDYKVYPYEPYKWVQYLRGYSTPSQSNPSDPRGKFIDYEANEGHSYGEKHFAQARGEDLAILESWANGTLRF